MNRLKKNKGSKAKVGRKRASAPIGIKIVVPYLHIQPTAKQLEPLKQLISIGKLKSPDVVYKLGRHY